MFLLFVGLAAIAATVALHAGATSLAISLLTRFGPLVSGFKRGRRAVMLGSTAVFFGFKHYIDMILWAVVYWKFVEPGQFDDFESAVYFSSVTYTSLGYGDLVLNDQWRLVCGLEAMNGIILFGWTTALISFMHSSSFIVQYPLASFQTNHKWPAKLRE